MWHLINPDLVDETVDNETVISFLQDMILISIDLIKKFLATLHGNEHIQLKNMHIHT